MIINARHAADERVWQAREQLGALFDEPDYDVACALKPLAWWARVCASSAEDGKRKELYYATIGAKMCESLGAINDETNEGFIRYVMRCRQYHCIGDSAGCSAPTP